jgi:hypothetical protein
LVAKIVPGGGWKGPLALLATSVPAAVLAIVFSYALGIILG